MSNFSTVLDSIYTTLDGLAALSSKTFIPNPYSVEDNNETFLRDGYGVVVGGSSQGFNEFKSTYADQDIGILLTKQVIRTDSNHDPLKEAIKALRDEGTAVRQEILGPNNSNLYRVNYVSTDGITFSEDIIYTTVNFVFTLIDDL